MQSNEELALDNGRLQAENAALQQRLNVADQRVDELQSELTKARELISEWRHGRRLTLKDCSVLIQRTDDFLAQQSAPAAKGGE
jgi:predicted  nucleic acid-binding Zn-ribbon protein